LDDGGQTGCVKMLAWWGVCPCAPEVIFNSLAGDIQPFPSILHWQTRVARLERENKLLKQQVASLLAATAAVATDGETPNKTTDRCLDGTVANSPCGAPAATITADPGRRRLEFDTDTAEGSGGEAAIESPSPRSMGVRRPSFGAWGWSHTTSTGSASSVTPPLPSDTPTSCAGSSTDLPVRSDGVESEAAIESPSPRSMGVRRPSFGAWGWSHV
jgi:hypothetical protein